MKTKITLSKVQRTLKLPFFEKKIKLTVNALHNKEFKIQEAELGFLVISGVFLKETTDGKLDEFNFLPIRKELSDIQIKLSDLRKVGAMWQKIGNLDKAKKKPEADSQKK